MLISTKGRYALRVMIDLSEHQSEKYVPLKEIAARQEISEKYLENILKGGAERRECIHLAFDGREPESIAPCIGKCGADTAAHNQGKFPCRNFRGFVRHNQTLDEMRHRPEKQQNGSCAQQGRHCIDRECRCGHLTAKEGDEETCRKHEDRVARRMAYFEFRALKNKLGTIPE